MLLVPFVATASLWQDADQMSSHQIPIAEPLVEVKRGSITESRHRGHIAVVDTQGNIIASLGVPETVTYLRSSAKPFQALSLLTSGAADRFGFTDREVALACGSHNGEPIHTELAASMLKKIGLGAEALHCGAHEPYGAEAALELRMRGEQPNALHNNCSGKHVGMLAVARHLGAPIENYERPENPVQKLIADAMSQFVQICNNEGKPLTWFGEPGNDNNVQNLPAKVVVDYDDMAFFEHYASPKFKVGHLVLVINQIGPHKVSVYGFGHMK